MDSWIKTIIIIFPIFVIGMIGLDALNATKLSILWLFVCIVLELVILELFAVYTTDETESKK